MFGSDASRYDLYFDAETGVATEKMEALRRKVHTATAGMSEDSLKLANATERYDKAVIRSKGEVTAAVRSAEINYRRALDQTTATVKRQDATLEHHQRTLSQASRGVLAGSGVMRGLGRSVAFASASFLGGAGLVYAIKSSIEEATNLHEQMSKTEVVFGSSANAIISWSKTTATSLGLADDKALEIASTFGALLRPMGVVEDKSAAISKRLTVLGADLASFYNTSVEDALQAVQSGLLGQARPLRRYGVALDAARVSEEAMIETGKTHASELTAGEKVLARYNLILKDTSLANGDFARTSGGLANQQRIVAAQVDDLKGKVGEALYPAVLKVTTATTKWLGSSENQKRIQDGLNTAVDDGTKIVQGMATALDDVRAVGGPVVDVLGGVGHAAQLALILGIALKARRAALSFGFITTASATTRNRIVTDAAAETVALDRVGVAAGRTGGKLRSLRGLGGVAAGLGLTVAGGEVGGEAGGILSTIGNYGLGGALVGGPVGAIIGLGVGAGIAGINSGKAETKALHARWNALTYEQQQATLRKLGDKAVNFLEAFGLKAKQPPISAGLKGTRPGEGRLGGSDGGYTTPKKISTTPTGDGLSPLQRLQLAELHATATTPLPDDLVAEKALLTYYKNVVDHGKLTGKELFKAKQDYEQQLATVTSVQEQIGQAAKTAADKHQRAIDKQISANKRAQAKLLATIAREEAEKKRIGSPYYYGGGTQEVSPVFAGKGSKAFTFEDFNDAARASFGAYGSNIGGILSGQDVRGEAGGLASGAITTQMLSELRTQTRALTAPRGPSPIDVAFVGARNGLD